MNNYLENLSEKRIKILYIAGSGRSGSTLLERILGQTDEMVSIGELRHIWLLNKTDLCGCGEAINVCPFWVDVFKEAFGGIEKVDFDELKALRRQVDRIRYLPQMLYPSLTNSHFKERFERYGNIIHEIYATLAQKFPGKVIIDSSKDISSLFLASTFSDVDLYILNLVRDSRGVAYSWHRRQKLRPEITDRKVYMRTHRPSKIAWEWTYRNFFVQATKKRVKGYTLVKYEDFITEPQKTIQKVLDLVEIKQSDLHFISKNTVSLTKMNHTVSGNPIRFKNGETALKLDQEWVSQMSFGDKLLVTLLTWPYLVKYHYPINAKAKHLSTEGKE